MLTVNKSHTSLVHKHIECNKGKYSSLIVDKLLSVSLNKKHSFYFYLTEYLAPAFDSISSSKLNALSFSVYGYFRSLLMADSLIDDISESSAKTLVEFIELYEASVVELAHLIPASSEFWVQFNQSKQKYFQTVMLEKQLHLHQDEFDVNEFEKIAEGKSAILTYNIVLAMEALQEKKHNKREEIMDYLRRIHIAFQYQDDIDDFKEDLKRGQPSYAQILVEQTIQKLIIPVNDVTPDFKYKFLFTSGTAVSLLTLAQNQYKQCVLLARELELDILANLAQTELERCEGQIREISLLIEKTQRKASKSNKPLFNSIVTLKEREVSASLNQSKQYLDRDEGNLWTDFVTTAGTSKYWVSTYVAYHLLSNNIKINKLPRVLETLESEGVEAAFNSNVPEDGDSLSFLIATLQQTHPNLIHNLIQHWKKYQDRSGGWVTYSKVNELRVALELPDDVSLKGWTRPVSCVSAVAGAIMQSLPDTSTMLEATRMFLKENQNKNGSWNSYWWTSPIYATTWAIRALSKDSLYANQCHQASLWIADQQKPNGGWHEVIRNQPSVYFSALALTSLIETQNHEFSKNIELGVKWLLTQQCSDGSWPSSRILAIPAPFVIDHSEVRHWRKSSFGTNTLVDDDNRIFTTVTALATISAYLKWRQK